MGARLLVTAVLVLASACFEPPVERRDAGDGAVVAAELEGCHYPGGLNRVGFRGVAPGEGLCAAFILVEAFGADAELDVQGWNVQYRAVDPAPCSGWGWGKTEDLKMRGSVTFDAVTTELPPALVDVYVETGLETPREIRLVGGVSEFDALCQ